MSSAPAGGHGDSHGAEAHAETPHTSRAKDPKIVHESQSIIGKIKMIFWWVAGIIIVLLVMKSCKGKKEEEKTSSKPQQSAPTAPETSPFEGRIPSSGRILMVDRKTPFSDQLDYESTMETEGDSVSITYPYQGGERTIKYLGKGDRFERSFGERSPGPVYFQSLDPNKQVRIRIYRVVNVYLPQP